ncbi:unnamed protein product [Arctogadus glacialis]
MRLSDTERRRRRWPGLEECSAVSPDAVRWPGLEEFTVSPDAVRWPGLEECSAVSPDAVRWPGLEEFTVSPDAGRWPGLEECSASRLSLVNDSPPFHRDLSPVLSCSGLARFERRLGEVAVGLAPPPPGASVRSQQAVVPCSPPSPPPRTRANAQGSYNLALQHIMPELMAWVANT